MRNPLLLLFTLQAALAAQTSFPLDPRRTFLRTNNDSPQPPLVIDLATFGAPAGTWLRIETAGGFRYVNGGTDGNRSLGGVFASSATLLATNVQRRVQDAIAAGPSVLSGATYSGALATDFPEDFYASRNTYDNGVLVEVPAGATHLFLGVYDSLFNDNADPNNDYAAVVTILPHPPLPGTGEHVELRTGVNGAATALPPDKTAAAGAIVTAELRDPLGLADGAIYVLAADLVATGGPVPTIMPRVWLGPSLAVLQVGVIGSAPGWSANWSLTTPAGLSGRTLVLQGGALQGGAVTTIGRNGVYETTLAHRIAFQ